VVAGITGDVSGGADIEKGNVSSSAKLAKHNAAAENLKVFTQVHQCNYCVLLRQLLTQQCNTLFRHSP
jgi:hypothetical protein